MKVKQNALDTRRKNLVEEQLLFITSRTVLHTSRTHAQRNKTSSSILEEAWLEVFQAA